MQHYISARRARRSITGLILALLVAAPHAAAATTPLAATGWHGRAIERPEPQRVATTPPPAWPAGWSAGGVRFGTGYHADRGSRRVREVQRELVRRGYRAGPVDGRFGPRTRGALLWFQVKHGLARSGVVDARTLAVLRTRPTTTVTPAEASAPVVAPVASPPVPRTPSGSTNVVAWIAMALVIALGLALLAAWLLSELRPRVVEPELEPGPHRLEVVAPTHSAVLGYIALEDEANARERVDAATRAIGAWCESRDWELRRVIHDVDRTGGAPRDRPGLAYVLDQIRTGQARGIVVHRLRDVTHSVAKIGPLLEWLDEADAFLIALDYALDTSQPSGRIAASALADMSEWERRRIAARTRRGLTAAAVSDDPELREQIVAMRSSGMSLQAIADTLNAAGVPTVRGGSQWRPSSVQSATGYKRPSAGARDLPRLRRVDE
jgi:DNA invertase Pin-like site-specific DNA recombinase